MSQYLQLLMASSAQIIQWREKDLSPRDRLHLIQQGIKLARSQDKLFLVNSFLELALKEGTDGVHLPGNQSVSQAVSLRVESGRNDFVIGKSVHSIEEGIRAEQEGADYVLLSPIFVPLSKISSRPVLGLQVLKQAVDAIRIPVFALGGVDESRFLEVFQAGAAGVAGISWIHLEVASHLDRQTN